MTDIGILGMILAGEKLKREVRKGWIVKAGIKQPESVADHSFVTALIAMVVGDNSELDTEKMIRMALLHDLAESIIGDLIPGENPSKKELENQAIESLMSELSGEMRSLYEALWNEFITNKSDEAIMVHQIDKFEMGIQAAQYLSLGRNEILQRFMQTAEDALDDHQLLNLWKQAKSLESQ